MTAMLRVQPEQSANTAGIPPMTRPGRLTRMFMAVVEFAERLNLRFARQGNPCVYPTAAFPWARALEQNWQAIRRELDQVLVRQGELPRFQDITNDVGTISKDDRWKTFLLCAYGIRSERAIARCPETWRLVQGIPGLKTAMFSIFEAGQHLPPHRGPYNGVLRFHLGLIVPEPRAQCAIRVGDELCHWREGEALIFDDAYEHEAWNRTDQTRVVLFVDFVKPLRFPANLMNWLLLHLAVFTPFIREGEAKHQAWEERFYGADKA
jgi:ornithine lipid ester-linked acyl 2-hydroxylase